MILNSLNQVRMIIINTIAGTEKAIVFLGKTFVAENVYASVSDAIAGCRRDIDMGMGVLIAPESEQFRVWIAVPEDLILKTQAA
ncbi:MAG: hypothetical protein AUK48_05590 [Oscillatoriales cyanobacterium CG2_30_44_21]|nr:MAG: hypothetical protein AUK48_05590 [Oscillatoriales cyanobacterium CG2_30_44_21]